jgi:hypothetical protein
MITIKEEVQMLSISGCSNDSPFGPSSWTWEVICPEMGTDPASSKLTPDEFVDYVVRRVPAWAASTLRYPPAHLLDESCQEFLFQILRKRPDLRFDATKGNKSVFLTFIILHIHWRIVRKWRKGLGCGAEIDDIAPLAKLPVPLLRLEHQEELGMLHVWIQQLPEKPRLVMLEIVQGKQCTCSSSNAHYIAVSRAMSMLRARMKNGARPSARMGRHRMKRSYLPRKPSMAASKCLRR